MKFNKHYIHEGQHALLSASKNSWLNYTDDQLEVYFRQAQATKEGNELHELAAMMIKKRVKAQRSSKTFNQYVNDAIGYRMTPEVLLVASENCFGTADAIRFDEARKLLRIHDLKTGVNKTSEKQLFIYAALFCIEYKIRPFEIEIECRIYQNDEVRPYIPTGDNIAHIMDKIRTFDTRIREMRLEDEL